MERCQAASKLKPRCSLAKDKRLERAGNAGPKYVQSVFRDGSLLGLIRRLDSVLKT